MVMREEIAKNDWWVYKKSDENYKIFHFPFSFVNLDFFFPPLTLLFLDNRKM